MATYVSGRRRMDGLFENLERRLCLAVDGFVETNVQCCPVEPRVVHVLDADGDGDSDILATSVSAVGSLLLFENDGEGNFEAGKRLSTSVSPYIEQLASADFDGDGDIDFTSGDYQFENLGDATFRQRPLGSLGDSVVDFKLGDLDGDGDVDMALARLTSTGDTELIAYANSGSGRFTRRTISTESVQIREIELKDANQDGTLDILVSRYSGESSWLPNDGHANFGEKQVFDQFGQPLAIEVADYNQDNLVDVVISKSRQGVLSLHANTGDPEAPFAAREEFYRAGLDAYGPDELRSVDLDGDGDLDLVSTANFVIGDTFQLDIRWFENRDGTFEPPQTFASDTKGFVRSAELADFNGDGLPDLVVAGLSDRLAWYANLGAGDFGEAKYLASTYASSKLLSDLDGDGDLDLVAESGPSSSAKSLVWFENSGGGVYSQNRTIMENAPRDLAAADLDGDGDQDLITIASRYPYEDVLVTWHVNDGRGTFTEQTLASLGDDATFNNDTLSFALSLVLSDLDADADLDPVFSVNDKVYKLENFQNESRFASAEQISSNDGKINDLAIADLNQDGILDLIASVRKPDADQVNIELALGNESGGFDDPQMIGQTSGVTEARIEVADADDDGDLDVFAAFSGKIVFLIATESKLALFENMGDGEFQKNELIGPRGFVRSFDVVDVDRDGDLDALVGGPIPGGVLYFEFDSNTKLFKQQSQVVNPKDRIDSTQYVVDFAIGDVNGNGSREIVVGTNLGISFFTPKQTSPIIGDADLDGVVGFRDFLILSKNFGKNAVDQEDGDFNGDNIVDFKDFLLLAANFGQEATR